ncbi:MAG: VWA domain-containing protein [Polyangiales bacterium]
MTLSLASFAARFPELGASEREAYVLLEVFDDEGREAPPASELRAPLCLSLALDASSSMRGARFALALQAARDVLSSLSPRDRFAVITFDRGARVVFGPVAVDAEGTNLALRALDRLSTGIGTNLGAGWREAAESVLRVMLPNADRRVLLLSDGFPSRGETDREALRLRVAEGRARGVETSVVGIGDGIDERLCASLAEAGEGRFHYVRDEGALGDVVAAEVDGAKAVAAREVSVLLALSNRVERAEVLHRYPCRPEGRTLDVRVGTVTFGSPRRVLASVELAEGSRDAVLGVAVARGRRSAPARVAALPTMRGFALGAAAVEEGEVESERASVSLVDQGSLESRRRVAAELLAQRTLAEVRSAWDAMDAGNQPAMLRRLERARAVRAVLLDAGLVGAAQFVDLPDLDVVQAAMSGAGGDAREARRRFASWAHNTQSSFVGAWPVKLPRG